MSVWDDIVSELDLWRSERMVAQFWWRDDDATDDTRALRQVLSVARLNDVEVAISIIPLRHHGRLEARIARERHACALVHGYAHANHAPAQHHKSEFCRSRCLQALEADLRTGFHIMREGFGDAMLPVLVPPWNQITPKAVAMLPGLGYRGISTWKPRAVGSSGQRFVQVNAHLDLIDWRRERAVRSEETVGRLLLQKLRWRRKRPVRAQEPLGLLTHHQLWSPEKERLVVRILNATRGHPAVNWQAIRSVFAS